MLPDGREYTVQALYRDIVPGRRIVYTYDMLLDGIRISASVATVEFKRERDGTRLVFTEQAAFLDGHEVPARREHHVADPTAAERPTGGRAPGTNHQLT